MRKRETLILDELSAHPHIYESSNQTMVFIHQLRFFYFTFFFFSIGHSYAQIAVKWERLADVEFEYNFVDKENRWETKKIGGKQVKELVGRKIVIKGYLLKADLENEVVVLSAYPFSSCFFCGGAGPESVIELHFKRKRKQIKVDEFVTLEGVFRLNTDDFALGYMLIEAKQID